MLLSVAEAAKELNVSPRRVRALIEAGRLLAERIGERTWAIDPKALDAVRVRKSGRPWPKKKSRRKRKR
ncbi:MAG TPA: helix-turn-helix domain-containing protein [Gemmataceae bacterium]|nr:helix-turn-helix domain-containing protein [Gemmataceae bacterium]